MFDGHVSYVAATLGRLGVEERDRDDLVSEVFVRVHRALPSYDATRPMKPWLFAFAARVASEHRRLARHRREVFAEVEMASSELAADETIERRQARQMLERALGELDEEKREVFVLHDSRRDTGARGRARPRYPGRHRLHTPSRGTRRADRRGSTTSIGREEDDMSELEPLEDDILALVGAAKQVPELTGARKAELFEATAAKIGVLPPGGGEGGGGTGAGAGAGAAHLGTKLTMALLATFTIGIAVGVIADRALSPDRNAQPVASASVLPASPLATDRDAGAHVAAIETISPASLPDAPKAAPAASTAPAHAASTEALSSRGLAAERALLDIARSALARGEAGEALAATSRHGREYPDGALVEEREAIAVKALVALGRKEEARTRVQALEQRFPTGLSVRAAKAAVDSAP